MVRHPSAIPRRERHRVREYEREDHPRVRRVGHAELGRDPRREHARRLAVEEAQIGREEQQADEDPGAGRRDRCQLDLSSNCMIRLCRRPVKQRPPILTLRAQEESLRGIPRRRHQERGPAETVSP